MHSRKRENPRSGIRGTLTCILEEYETNDWALLSLHV